MHREDNDHHELNHLREIADFKMNMFADQVRKLNELRDEGLLSDEEFTSKKAELLSRL